MAVASKWPYRGLRQTSLNEVRVETVHKKEKKPGATLVTHGFAPMNHDVAILTLADALLLPQPNKLDIGFHLKNTRSTK